MTKLSVNVNKIATLRNTRALGIPDVVRLSAIALDSGADGITVHPRPDERHIRPADVDQIAQLLQKYPNAEFNIEGNPYHGLVEHCERVKPTQATLVPDAQGQSTSDHGWPLHAMDESERARLRGVIEHLSDIGCRVSLFVDPEPKDMPIAAEIGADRIELYTEPYAAASARGDPNATLLYSESAWCAIAAGLGVNAGHDLSLENLADFLHGVRKVDEVSIGHALIADALEFGMAETVRRYVAVCRGGRAVAHVTSTCRKGTAPPSEGAGL
ncbi:MAG TPA: pyridoxine 5'-phosphate synthase [Tepidisphaeraceae bacterium]|jgi:pyridoxine 5-phosphate synthase